MAYKCRKVKFTGNVAKKLALGSLYGVVRGYNVYSSADQTTAVTAVDADGKTIFTVPSADYTNTTGKDGVEFVLSPEGPTGKGVTEDGTDATPNGGMGAGVWAKGPLTLTAAGVGSGYLLVEVYVQV